MLIHNAEVTGSLTINGIPYNTGSFTGSFFGDGSQLSGVTSYTNADTLAFINSIEVVSGSIETRSTVSDTFTSVTSYTVTHNFNTKEVIVSVYENDTLIFPSSINTPTTNTVTITFPEPVTGRVVVVKAGHIVSGSINYDSVLNKPTLVSGSSQITYSDVTGIPSGIVSSSSQIVEYNVFATTGSNQFDGSQVITGSLTVTGEVVAQTLNVQEVTSSIVFSSGSNIFGNDLGNTQQLTGSVSITGSLTVNGSGLVPYTGATADVNLGNFDVLSRYLNAEGSPGLGGVLNIKQDAVYLPKGNGYSSIASSFTAFDFYGYTGASTYKNFSFRFDSLTDNTLRIYTLPNADGTLALTSNLGDYLPLTGGTLTGALNGTSASFTGAVTSAGNIFTTNDAVFSTAGSITKHATVGLVLRGVTAAVFDLALYSANGTAMMTNPAGSTNLNFNAGCNVGMGGTLNVTGAATFSSSVGVGGSISGNYPLTIRSTAADYTKILDWGTGVGGSWGTMTINIDAPYQTIFNSGGGFAFTGGNVGIGTASPQALLTVSGANQALGGAFNTTGNVLITSNEGPAINRGGSLSLGGRYWTGNTTIATFGRIHGKKEDASDGSTAGYLSFETTREDGALLFERMRITSGGIVSVGNNTSNGVLELNTTLPLSNFAQTTSQFYIKGNVRYDMGPTTNYYPSIWRQQLENIGAFSGTSDLVYATSANGGAYTEQMRISGGGRYLRMASGTGGIQFGGDSAAANALNDYEEGTWTPTISGLNLSVARANYVKIGSLVYIMATMGYGSGTGSGNIIGGLPFAASAGNRSGLSFGNVNGINWGSGATSPFGFVYESTIACYGFSNNAGFTTADFSSFGSLDFIEFSAVYSTL
jgi:hypothetical protein